jgi:AraC-like DNA-binding protein
MAAIDPELFRMLLRLHAAADGLRSVALWTSRDAPLCDGHDHAVPTLVVCLDGVVRITSARRRLDLHPCEALLLAPGAWHRHETLRPGALVYLQGFIANGSDMLIGDTQSLHGGMVPSQPSWSLLQRALTVKPADRTALVTNCLQQAINERTRSPGSMPAAVRAIYAQLWWNPPATLTIAGAVRASGLHASQAHAQFKAWSGTTPKRTLLALRTSRALQYLREGARVGEAASRAGFAAPYLLARAFRARFGIPPRCWREVIDESPP